MHSTVVPGTYSTVVDDERIILNRDGTDSATVVL
jgi:hypothetical protein